jgi:hypothetical protein
MQDATEVTDLAVSAFLMARGFPVVSVTGRRGRRVFVFAPEAQSECTRYFTGATIEARAFAEAMRSLKALLHHMRSDEESA